MNHRTARRLRATPDAALVDALANGDEVALRELYHRHARWLLARLRRRTADRGLAEEAVQDAFVKAWRRADTYRGEGDVGAWLWRIATRSMLDLVRRRVPTPLEPPIDEESTTDSPEDRVLFAAEHEDVSEAVRSLPERYQAVLHATVVDELTTREAADLLGIPVGTVKSHAMRARAQLRTQLA